MKLHEFLEQRIQTPKPWGLYHFSLLFVVLIASVLVCVFLRNLNDRKFRKVLLIIWLVFIAIELYKQLTHGIIWICNENGEIIDTQYRYSDFPFQFCSTPFYVLPLIIFLPEGKVRDSFLAFTATYLLFAGLITLFIPETIFCSQLDLNIHTSIHHGLQVITGIFIAVNVQNKFTKGIKVTIKWFASGAIVFAAMCIIAIIINEVFYYSGIIGDYDFNMFYISRHFSKFIPVISLSSNEVPYIIYLLGYVISFSLVSLIVTLIEYLFVNLSLRKEKQKKALR